VQETAGVVLGFAFDDREDTSWLEDPDHAAWARGWVLLKYLPRGVHVRIDVEPDAEAEQYVANEERGVWTFTPEAAMSDKINLDGQAYYFTRAQLPLYSADDGTTNSLQGATKDYIIADSTLPRAGSARKGIIADDDDGPAGRGRYWSHMYVKCSRVRDLDHLLLLNPPENLREIMEAGPPQETVAETQRIVLLERNTVPKAEAALRRLTWEADDDYYGAEECARLRAWAEADWAHAQDEEDKRRAEREREATSGESDDGAGATTPRNRPAGQKTHARGQKAPGSPPGKRRQQQDIRAWARSRSQDIEVTSLEWGVDLRRMHLLMASCYPHLPDYEVHSVDLGQYCRVDGIRHSNMSRPPRPAALRPAPPRSAPLRPAPPRSAPLRPAPPRSAPLRPAPPLRSAPLRSAPRPAPIHPKVPLHPLLSRARGRRPRGRHHQGARRRHPAMVRCSRRARTRKRPRAAAVAGRVRAVQQPAAVPAIGDRRGCAAHRPARGSCCDAAALAAGLHRAGPRDEGRPQLDAGLHLSRPGLPAPAAAACCPRGGAARRCRLLPASARARCRSRDPTGG
jgi:hypothetical protein